MKINEAVRLAIDEGKCIYKESEILSSKFNLERDWKIMPTKSLHDCCMIYDPQKKAYGIRWNPTVADLLADDWQITD